MLRTPTVNVMGRSAAHAELDDLRTPAAVIDTLGHHAESSIVRRDAAAAHFTARHIP
jgi:hypothetical protein